MNYYVLKYPSTDRIVFTSNTDIATNLSKEGWTLLTVTPTKPMEM